MSFSLEKKIFCLVSYALTAVQTIPQFLRICKLTLFSILARISKNLDYEEYPSSRMTFPITLNFDDTIILLWFGRIGEVLMFEKVHLLPDAPF